MISTKGFAFTGLVVGNGGRRFHPNDEIFTIIVGSGASDDLLGKQDNAKTTGQHGGFVKLEEPKIIVTAGNENVFATTTGPGWTYIIDQTGQRVPVWVSDMVVPALERNLFSCVKALHSGLSTISEPGNSHLQFNGDTSLPLNQRPEYKGLWPYRAILRARGSTIETAPTTPPDITGYPSMIDKLLRPKADASYGTLTILLRSLLSLRRSADKRKSRGVRLRSIPSQGCSINECAS